MTTLTPEGKVKSVVKNLLRQHKAWQFWPVQSGYGEFTLDCIGCHNGRFFAIETKAPGKKATVRQNAICVLIRAAGGAAFILDGTDMEGLVTWLSQPTD